ncbi:MAG: hypothetical protein ACPIOQ_76205, partial [Promethearchaeia archaeon]
MATRAFLGPSCTLAAATSRGKTDRRRQTGAAQNPRPLAPHTFSTSCHGREPAAKLGSGTRIGARTVPHPGAVGSAAGTAHRSCSMTTQSRHAEENAVIADAVVLLPPVPPPQTVPC